MAKEDPSNLLKMADDNGVSEMVRILRQVKTLGWHERAETTYGGSFRYLVRIEPGGKLRVLFGVNASGKFRPLHGSLWVWVRPKVAAAYRGTSEANIRDELQKFAPSKDDFIRISSPSEAFDLFNSLRGWSADFKSTTVREKSSETSA